MVPIYQRHPRWEGDSAHLAAILQLCTLGVCYGVTLFTELKEVMETLREEPKLKTLLVQSGFRERSQDLTYVNYHLSPQTPTLRIPHQSPLFTDQASDLRHLQRLFSLPSPASFQVWQIQLLAQSISSF